MAPGDRSGGVGLLGGTFDPPHVAHVVMGVTARDELGLDRVELVVANDPWQKRGRRPITPASDRLALARAAVAGVPGLSVSDREVRRGGPSYTIDTVEELLDEDPASEIWLVVGADAAAGLDTWHRAGELRGLVQVAVLGRRGIEAAAPVGWRWRLLDMPALDISSTDLRARVAAGRPIDGLVPPAVRALVDDMGLYRGTGL